MIGIVADDITGANDIGIMFAKSNCLTHVYSWKAFEASASPQVPDVLILDTDSRFDAASDAYDKVFNATRRLQGLGCDRFINKTCSVFRGNIGAELDAMLDALGHSFAVLVLGFPKNGRTTVNGIHYVHGKKLEDSEFRHDPVHPMTQSNLVDMLREQTNRPVGLITHETVGQGSAVLKLAIEGRRPEGGYLILDVTDQADLAVIAEAVKDEKVICGSSALAEELAGWWKKDLRIPESAPDFWGGEERAGILCTAGSLMPQTAAQIAYLKEHGAEGQSIAVFRLDAMRLFEEGERSAEIGELTIKIADKLNLGQHVLLHSENDRDAVSRTKAEGTKRGMSNTDVSRMVSRALAEITAGALARSGQNRLVVAGGDTSAAVCERLGIHGMRVWKEIDAGLPSCLSLSDPPMLLVLKSGSFGKPDFLAEAIEHLLIG